MVSGRSLYSESTSLLAFSMTSVSIVSNWVLTRLWVFKLHSVLDNVKNVGGTRMLLTNEPRKGEVVPPHRSCNRGINRGVCELPTRSERKFICPSLSRGECKGLFVNRGSFAWGKFVEVDLR